MKRHGEGARERGKSILEELGVKIIGGYCVLAVKVDYDHAEVALVEVVRLTQLLEDSRLVPQQLHCLTIPS